MRVIAACAVAMLAGGCGSVYQPGSVARDWSCKMRELQVQPVFPPREGVQVGDIFITAVPKDKSDTEACASRTAIGLSLPKGDDGFVPISIFYHSLPVGKEVAEFYVQRLDLPKTESAQLSVANGKISDGGYQTPVAANGLVRAPSSPGQGVDYKSFQRLRVVGFPDFMSVKVSGSDLGAILPVLGMPAEVGFGAEATESAAISVPVAESYGLPASTIITGLKTLKLNGAQDEGNQGQCSWRTSEIQELFPKALLEKSELMLSGVYEVYYTRAISANLLLKQSGALGINRNRSRGDDAMGEGGTTLPTGETSANGNANGVQQGNGTDAANALSTAKAIATAANALARRQNLPGVTLDFSSASSSTIGMTRVFERPIAIGYRAVNYKLSDVNGCVHLAQLSNTTTTVPAGGVLGEKARN